ncbi:MAG TPA: hypothetical protein VHL11_22520 [Phototrophicaceae bacterium]|nr:hypothetical protein [Phototrophicaceae bacterium]
MTVGAGYSGTPLIKKLGIKPPMRILLLHPPENYDQTLGEFPDGITLVETLAEAAQAPLDFIQFFTLQRAELEAMFADLKAALTPAGMLWISWVKKSARIPTDLTEDIIRQIALDGGLVDVKVCAVDANWSGLKLVYRLQDRP